MGVIVIMALLAALGFHREARKRGYPSIRLVIYPFGIAGVLLLGATLLGFVIERSLSERQLTFASPILDVGCIALYFWAIRRAWLQVKALPPKPATASS